MAVTDFSKTAREIVAQRAKEAQEQSKTHLSPIKHRQQDFFIADIFDALTFRSDIASMEFPLFALKAGDFKTVKYTLQNFKTVVAPNAEYGRATIHDKDIWIYCISKLQQAISEGKEISRTIRFTIYDYLVTTNRQVNGRTYELTKNALNRLSGTRITTEIETAKKKEATGFGLIDTWRIIEEKEGRMIRVEVTLPNWLYRSITTTELLKISSDYFRLRRPLDRRIYELARKHCGNQKEFKINLDLLHKKSGSTAPLPKFRMNIKSLVASNDLPDYFIQYDDKKDMVIFNNRNIKSLLKGLVNGISKHK